MVSFRGTQPIEDVSTDVPLAIGSKPYDRNATAERNGNFELYQETDPQSLSGENKDRGMRSYSSFEYQEKGTVTVRFKNV